MKKKILVEIPEDQPHSANSKKKRQIITQITLMM